MVVFTEKPIKVNPADCQKRHLFCLRKNAPLLATADSRRVCRAWHLTSQMKVLIPGIRRAEG